MSSSPTAATSTIASSSASPSPSEPGGRSAQGRRIAVIACGAIAQQCGELARRHGWPVDVHPLPPLLHNRPERIAGALADLSVRLDDYDEVAVGFADCGTYGAVDTFCRARGLRRLPGLHCYDLYAGAGRLRAMLEQEPGTYLLTDFLVRSFRRTVVAELGLDRHPELREEYFAHYSRVVWLAQHPTPELARLAAHAAALLDLPLTTVPTGLTLLEEALAELVGLPTTMTVPAPL